MIDYPSGDSDPYTIRTIVIDVAKFNRNIVRIVSDQNPVPPLPYFLLFV